MIEAVGVVVAVLERVPWWVLDGYDEEPVPSTVVPEVPGWLLEGPEAWRVVAPECAEVSLLTVPVELAEVFAREWRLVQRHTARLWQAAAAMHAACPAGRAEFVADDLALLTNTHPRSGLALLVTALAVVEVPELLALVEAGELGDKHVHALLEEAGRWTDSPQARQQVLALTLQRCAPRVGAGRGWPTPGQLRGRVRTAALLLDLTAAEKAKRSVAERRGVGLHQSGIGAATLSIEGPEVAVVQMMTAIRARAHALGRLAGDTRTSEQRLFDAAHDLLLIDADGGPSEVAALDAHGRPVTITVRGVEVSLLLPYSTAVGGDLELAEIPGLGPVLPSTARELLAQADSLRRIAVHADTGQVIAVDDRVRADGDLTALLAQLATTPVTVRDLSSTNYRVPRGLRQHIERRDRTCTFPGCTVPGERCDIDHREPWPHGPTDDTNCHCLCRHHHRAKQAYFTVETDQDGTTVWTTPDGRRYRRPPPTY